MAYADDRTEAIPVALPNGTTIKVEVARTGREDVAFHTFSFKQITDALEGVVDAIAETLQKAQPKKATVKFGLEVAVEAGQLTALIAKGSGKANLEITLEWSK
jgi:hypothetical protein